MRGPQLLRGRGRSKVTQIGASDMISVPHPSPKLADQTKASCMRARSALVVRIELIVEDCARWRRRLLADPLVDFLVV